jgi:hypothetical protein
MNTQSHTSEATRSQFWTVLSLSVVILFGCAYGFGEKLIQLFKVAGGDPDGIFALTPIINYLMASVGFLLLMAWAATNGMFRDIERPKCTMLENEQELEASEHFNTRTICEARKR